MPKYELENLDIVVYVWQVCKRCTDLHTVVQSDALCLAVPLNQIIFMLRTNVGNAGAFCVLHRDCRIGPADKNIRSQPVTTAPTTTQIARDRESGGGGGGRGLTYDLSVDIFIAIDMFPDIFPIR